MTAKVFGSIAWPPRIDAAVQAALDGGHADRIGVEHAGGVRIVAQLRWIAGDEEQVADSAGGAGQQVGLHADEVAVAAAEVEDCLDARLPLNVVRGNQRGDARAGPRAVGDVDRVDAPLPQPLAFCRDRREVIAAGRHEFDRGDPLPRGQSAGEPRFLRKRGRLLGRRRFRRRRDGRLPPGQRLDGQGDLANVLRSGPAAPAHRRGPQADEPFRVGSGDIRASRNRCGDTRLPWEGRRLAGRPAAGKPTSPPARPRREVRPAPSRNSAPRRAAWGNRRARAPTSPRSARRRPIRPVRRSPRKG